MLSNWQLSGIGSLFILSFSLCETCVYISNETFYAGYQNSRNTSLKTDYFAQTGVVCIGLARRKLFVTPHSKNFVSKR